LDIAKRPANSISDIFRTRTSSIMCKNEERDESSVLTTFDYQ